MSRLLFFFGRLARPVVPCRPGVPGASHRSHARVGLLIAALAVGAGLRHANAQDSGDGRTRYSVGAVVLVDKDGYRGVGSESLLVPGLAVRNKWVSLYGPQLDLRLVGDDKRTWWIGPRIEYRFDGYEQDDSVFLRGMANRKGGVFYGVAGSVELGAGFEVEADYVKAASREAGFDRGGVGSLQLSRAFREGSWSFVPRIGLEYQSSRYVDYYYGVRPNEAAPSRPAYRGRSTWSPEVGLLVRWQASPRQSVFANLNYERYAKEIRNSPLIDATGIPQMVIGYEFALN